MVGGPKLKWKWKLLHLCPSECLGFVETFSYMKCVLRVSHTHQPCCEITVIYNGLGTKNCPGKRSIIQTSEFFLTTSETPHFSWWQQCYASVLTEMCKKQLSNVADVEANTSKYRGWEGGERRNIKTSVTVQSTKKTQFYIPQTRQVSVNRKMTENRAWEHHKQQSRLLLCAPAP